METEELVALHARGSLVDDAYPILESELARRGIAVGPRPPEIVPPPELPFFAGHWSGSLSSGSANGFAAALVPALLSLCLLGVYRFARYWSPENPLVTWLPAIFAIAMLGYCTFAAVAVWRCARNAGSGTAIAIARYKGYRVLVLFVAGALMVLGKSVPP